MQVLVTYVASLVALVAGGVAAAKSAALGGAIGVIPSAAYGLLLIKKPFGTPRQLLQRQYLGEFSKLGLTLADVRRELRLGERVVGVVAVRYLHTHPRGLLGSTSTIRMNR